MNQIYSVLLFCVVISVFLSVGCQNNNPKTVDRTNRVDTAPSDALEEVSPDDKRNNNKSPQEIVVPILSGEEQAKTQIRLANRQKSDIDDSGSSPSATVDLPTLDDVLANPRDPEDDEFRGTDEESIEEVQTIDIPSTWKRLSEKQEIWVDFKNKEVIAAGHVCMNAGMLEVFICPRRTKEHESVISLNALSEQVHAALLAIGAEPGHPVQWMDDYKPAAGPVIDINVIWKSDEKIIKRRGQEMVRDIDSGKPMEHDWVFGGSILEEIPETGESYYHGNSGELVCLSNFSTATMDIPVKSSDVNSGLLFEANTPNIPDIGTKVYVLFKPQLESAKK